MFPVNYVSIALEEIFRPYSTALGNEAFSNDEQSFETTAQMPVSFSNDT